MYCAFFDEAAEAFDMYEGNQWTEEEKEELRANNLVPYVSNQIASRIDNVSGSEILTRTRFKFEARTMVQRAAESASALTDVVMFLQQRNSSSSLWSMAMLKARICGPAWHHLLPVNDTIEEKVESPLNIVWDTADQTYDFSDSRGQGVVGWYSRDKLFRMYPDKKDEIERATGDYSNEAMQRPKGILSHTAYQVSVRLWAARR